jgi:hypothetical protein
VSTEGGGSILSAHSREGRNADRQGDAQNELDASPRRRGGRGQERRGSTTYLLGSFPPTRAHVRKAGTQDRRAMPKHASMLTFVSPERGCKALVEARRICYSPSPARGGFRQRLAAVAELVDALA